MVCPATQPLSRIVDLAPNRMFDARWSGYQIETTNAIVLTMPGGAKETLSRSAIKDMKSLDRPLMPDGLEAAISKQQMSDLIAFLLGK